MEDFEITEDESVASENFPGNNQTAAEKLVSLQRVISEFTFSQDDENDRMEEFIDLAVPIQYKVKFNFTPEKVMMRLSKDRLRRLEKVWEQSEEGLSLVEFMKLMILEVPSLKEEKLEMINGLIHLFKQVDINGDKMMQWSEFVQYMIDQVLQESIVATKDVQGNVASIGQQIKLQQAGQFYRMKRSGVPPDKGRHRNQMADVIMCQDTKNKSKTVVMHSEKGSATLQWYSLDLKPITQMQVPVKKKIHHVLHIAHQDLSQSLYSFGPQGTDAVYGVLCSDHILYFYIRNRGRIELFYQIDTGNVVQGRVWFMSKHKAWLTAGTDFKIRQWNVSPLVSNHQMGEPVQLHSDFITDCVEISNPLCIATCSLDRSIVLYDLKNKEALRRFSRKHVTGVRHLRYMEDFGGILISAGYEIFANVWGPQNLFGNAHLGRLKGHRCPIVAIDVLNSRPFVFSLDNSNELIIWDIRNYTPLQIIPAPSKEKMCHGILAINASLLWVYGHRFITYDQQETFAEGSFEVAEVEDKSMAINAFHNQFFQTICVQTPQDLKIYSCLDGQLMVMHQSVFRHQHVNCTQILQDKRHRKAYIASNNGKIEAINIQSGVHLKSVFEDEDEKRNLEHNQKLMANKLLRSIKPPPQISATTSKKTSPRVTRPASSESIERSDNKAFLTEAPTTQEQPQQDMVELSPEKDHTEVDADGVIKREIVDMILVWENKANQIIYADKSGYYVYNEQDEKKSEQLRQVTGGHKTSITTIKFSYHLSLIATGTESGEVAVWDYELSQLLGICQGHSPQTGEITAIEFMQPYPVMVTAGEDCKVILWAVRPTPTEQCYVTIGMFYNVSFNYDDDSKYPVRSLLGLCDKLKGISRGTCMKHSQINASVYRDYKTTQVLATKEAAVRVDERGQYRGLSQMQEIRLKYLQDFLNTDENGMTKIQTQFETMRLQYLPRMECLDPEYDDKIDEEKMRAYLYLGDDFGMMKIWDLTYLLETANIKPCRAVAEVRGDQYFPNRTEKVNVSSYANRLRKIAFQNYKLDNKRVKDPEDEGLIIRECVAHEKPFTRLNPHNFDGLMSIGKDCQVRIWSYGLDLWGIIDTTHYRGDVLWYFPTKDKEERENSDINKMQILANQLRTDDEQAVTIERDAQLAEVGATTFTEDGIYNKMNSNFSEKKKIKLEAELKEENAIIQERREWNAALQAAKPKAPTSLYVQQPFNKNLRVIERIEELGVAEDQLYDRIFFKEPSQYKIKGDVVVETSKRMDQLIAKALKEHQRPSGLEIPSPSRSPQRKRVGLVRRSGGLTSSRNVSKAIDSPSPGNSPSISPRRIISNKLSSNMVVNNLVTPLRSPKVSKKLSQVGSPFQQQQQQSPRKVSDDQEATTPGLITLQRVKAPKVNLDRTLQAQESELLSKTGDPKSAKTSSMSVQKGSSMSLNKETSAAESSKTKGAESTLSRPVLIDTIPEESDIPQWQRGIFVERTLDQLNKTRTLMKKVEESALKQTTVEQYVDDKEYIEDTQEDRKHLIAMKNLPSIRDKLFSIKTKHQRAILNPKYNKAKSGGSKTGTYPLRSVSTLHPSILKEGSASLANSQIAPSKLHSHHAAMQQLATVARDLENYNKNRYFNERARSLMVSHPQQHEMASHEDQQHLSNNNLLAQSNTVQALQHQMLSNSKQLVGNAESSLILGQVEVMSGQGGSRLDMNLNSIQQASVQQQQPVMSQLLLNDESMDADTMTQQLRDFQSQLLIRDNSKRQDRLKLRNIAVNSRTPNNLKRNNLQKVVVAENQSLERLRKNQSSVYRLSNGVELPNVPYLQNGTIPMGGPHITLNRADNHTPSGKQSASIIFDAVAGSSAGRQGRNAAKRVYETDKVPQSKTDIRKMKLEELMANGGPVSSTHLSSQFKKKVLGEKYNIEAYTAAQSNTIDHTLEKDASRQYLDINFSIGDSYMPPSKQVQAYNSKGGGHMPRNMSISNMSASEVAAKTDYSSSKRYMMGPVSSLYGDQPIGEKTDALSLSQTSGRRRHEPGNRDGNSWRGKRRQSEKTRLNEATGLLEQINVDEQRKNKYSILKQKYTGKESGLALLFKKEAENIQRQRERINELKDYKSVIRNLKGNSIDAKVATEQ